MSMRRPGSSLVFVLLTMAVISVVLLAGSAALLSAARQRSALESSKVAEQMRQSALQEGLARIKQGVLQYGVGTSDNLIDRVRGFQSGTNCQLFVGDTGSLNAQLPAGDADCPHYEVAIRNTVTATDYTYQLQDLTATATTDLPITGFTMLSFTIINTGLQNATITCEPVTACSGSGSTILATNATKVTISNVQPATGAVATSPALAVRNVLSGQLFTIGKAFTTIEAAGMAADGSESRSLTIIRPSGTVTSLTTQRFNAQGFCQPSPDACR